jgi:hypothetical protein
LGAIIPRVHDIFAQGRDGLIEGGFVFAQGQGSLGDRRSTIHRRDRFGITRRGRYVSIDTGKYSTAPLMAQTLAKDIAGTR